MLLYHRQLLVRVAVSNLRLLGLYNLVSNWLRTLVVFTLVRGIAEKARAKTLDGVVIDLLSAKGRKRLIDT